MHCTTSNTSLFLWDHTFGCFRTDGDISSAKTILNEIATEYSDIDVKLNDVFQICESEVSGILDQLHNASEEESVNGDDEGEEDTSSESEESWSSLQSSQCQLLLCRNCVT